MFVQFLFLVLSLSLGLSHSLNFWAKSLNRVSDTPSSADCTKLFYEQTLDHFNSGLNVFEFGCFFLTSYEKFYISVFVFLSFVIKESGPGGISSFQQRYFECAGKNWKPNDPIFFYCGNEADVTLYVNHTGPSLSY